MRDLPLRSWRRCAAVLLTAASLASLSACFSQGYARSRKRPFGQLEWPQPGVVATTPYGVRGWALSEAGIQNVWIFVDRKFYVAAQIKALRSDVAKVYPNLPDSSRAGFGAEIDIYLLKNGPHEITAQAVGNNGMTADVGTSTLIVKHDEDTKK